MNAARAEVSARELRLGLIGAGAWGANIARTLNRLAETRRTGAHLTTIVSSRPESRDLLPAGGDVIADWRDLMSADRVDAIAVAVPPAVQPDIVMAALDARLPVFAEKPLALDIDSAEAMAARARDADVPLIVDHIHLFNPAFRALVAAARTLGPITAVHTDVGRRGFRREGLDILWDFGPHDVAMCLELFGTLPDRVDARRHGDGAAGTEGLEIDLGFGAVAAHIRISNAVEEEKRRRFTVEAEGGVFRFDDFAKHKLTIENHAADNDMPRPLPYDTTLPLDVACLAFIEAARGRHVDHSAMFRAVAVVRILIACEEALKP